MFYYRRIIKEIAEYHANEKSGNRGNKGRNALAKARPENLSGVWPVKAHGRAYDLRVDAREVSSGAPPQANRHQLSGLSKNPVLEGSVDSGRHLEHSGSSNPRGSGTSAPERSGAQRKRKSDTPVSPETTGRDEQGGHRTQGRVTVAELWREFRYHALVKPPLVTRNRIQIRRDGVEGWTIRLIARTNECEELTKKVNAMVNCRAHFGLRPSPRYSQLICDISADRANEKERQMMDNAAKGIWK